MLKGKKSLYLLIPVVVLLWGTIMYRIFNYTSDEDQVDPISVARASKPVQNEESRKRELKLNYPDPFLKEGFSSPTTQLVPAAQSLPPTATQQVSAAEPKSPDPFAGLIYNGFIVKEGTDERIALLEHNNRSYLTTTGETFAGTFEVGRILKDSIQVIAAGKSTYIFRK